jgi:hypothetical protein
VRRPDDAPALTPSDIYRLYFHGPAFQVVGEAWRANGGAAGRLADHLPDDRDPSTARTVLGPRLEELCFQVAGLWEAGREGRLALPAHVDRLSVLAELATEQPERAVAVARPVEGRPGVFDCQVLDSTGGILLRLEGYRTIPLPGGLSEEVSSPLRHVMARQD